MFFHMPVRIVAGRVFIPRPSETRASLQARACLDRDERAPAEPAPLRPALAASARAA